MKIQVSSQGPGVAQLKKQLADLAKKQVYVGVPESTTVREEGEMTNAALLYLHTHGSALHHLPARPVLEPAIRDAHTEITATLGKAAEAILDGKPEEAEQALERAGLQGANACKRWFTNPKNAWPPNSAETAERKGSSQPLIDTGELRRSITSLVGEK